MKKNLILLSSLIVVTFILNLIWENLQMPLYVDYIPHKIWGIDCLEATLGDALIVLIIYFIVAIKRKKLNWLNNYTKSDIFLFLSLGFLISVGFEKFALYTGRFSYSSLMPILPLVNVGLVPVLQMLILPFVSLKIVNKINNK